MRTYHYLTLLFLGIFNISNAQMTPTLDDIWIPTRDSMQLQADVYIPTGVDSAEVILIQTPYNKNAFEWSLPMGVGQNVDSQPFIWVVVDWRGFYGSNAAINGPVNRGEDAYDICEWISQQIWHKSRIGTWGPSALGGVQYNLILEQHPNHTCAVPLVAHGHQSYDAYFYGGVLERARLEQLDALGYGVSPTVLANPYHNLTWAWAENNTWMAPDVHIPTLQIGGWYDHNIDKMVDFYEDTRTATIPSAQDKQWFLVGPWVHGGSGAAYVGSSVQGELSYPNAEFKSDSMAWDFLQYYLLDTPNNWPSTDFITYYEMGLDQWATSNATNIEILNTDILKLDFLTLQPQDGTGSSTFVSDPSNPSPTIGGATLHTTLDQGPFDQSILDSRSDITTFTTGQLTSDISISGRVKLNLYVEADQPDCDVAVRLVDVYPNGDNMLINDGIKRMRFRNGYTESDEAFMTPGNVYNVEVDMPFVNYTWLAGHRIKVYISGNHSYRFDVNLQNGDSMYVAGDTNIANISIHHNPTYPSYIELPGNNPVLSSPELFATQYSIYPNPVTDIVTIQTKETVELVELLDMFGRTVRTYNKTNTFNVADLRDGVYLVRINGAGVGRLQKH